MALTARLRLVLACVLLASFAVTASGCNKKRYRITETSTDYLFYAQKVKEKKDGTLVFMDTLMTEKIELEPDDWSLEEMDKKEFDERIRFHRTTNSGEVGGPEQRRIKEEEEFPEDDG